MLVNNKCECGQKLDKDTIALNKKLLGRQTKCRLCLKCLANLLSTTEEELNEKIAFFKEEGCTLFI